MYGRIRDYSRAEELYHRSIELDSFNGVYYSNLMRTQVALGKFDDAQVTLERFAENLPGNPEVLLGRARAAFRAAWPEAAVLLG